MRKKLKKAKESVKVASEVSKKKTYKNSNHINKQQEALKILRAALKSARDARSVITSAMKLAITALSEDRAEEPADWFQMSHDEVREGYCTLCGYLQWIDDECLCLGCFDASYMPDISSLRA